MNKFSRDLMQGLREAVAIAEGDRSGARVHVVPGPNAAEPGRTDLAATRTKRRSTPPTRERRPVATEAGK